MWHPCGPEPQKVRFLTHFGEPPGVRLGVSFCPWTSFGGPWEGYWTHFSPFLMPLVFDLIFEPLKHQKKRCREEPAILGPKMRPPRAGSNPTVPLRSLKFSSKLFVLKQTPFFENHRGSSRSGTQNGMVPEEDKSVSAATE